MGRRSRSTGLPDEWLGEWIGRWLDGRRPQIVRIRLAAGDAECEHPVAGSFDLPGEGRFDRPVRGWWRTSSDVFADRLTIDLDGEVGTADRIDDRSGDRSGDRSAGRSADRIELRIGGRRLRLYPARPLAAEELRPWMGEYAGGRCRLALGMSIASDPARTHAYYAEGDSVVRLYPIRSGLMLSERGETLILRDFGRRAGRYVAFQNGPGGRCVELARSRAPTEEPARIAVSTAEPLPGRLLLPAGDGPHPAVVLVHDTPVGRGDFYRMFAHPIVRRGIATLIYDRPERSGSMFEQAAGVDAAVGYLRGRSDIGPIGLIGFGAGMWPVPMVAAGRRRPAFVAGIGAPGVTLADTETYRRTRVLIDAGLGEETVRRVRRAWSLIFALASTGHATKEAAAELDLVLKELRSDADLTRFAGQQGGPGSDDEPMPSPIPPALSADDLVARLSGVGDPELGHDPVADYRRVGCPVLLLYGEQDRRVPVAESINRIRDGLRQAGNDRLTASVYPGAGHLLRLQTGPGGGVVSRPADEEYAEANLHRFRFVPGAIDELTSWLHARASATSRR